MSNGGLKKYLGNYLQGVHHFGYTVDDMDKSMEFYTEVLGGKVAVSGDQFVGSVLHYTLFQKEELEAIQKGVHPKTLGVPDLRDGSEEALDVRFVSFGNVVVELIHFRNAELSPSAPNWASKLPTSVGYANSAHLSFYVKDDVDLNQFAVTLEEECRNRGIPLFANSVIHVNSEEERRRVALKYRANKFWGDHDNPDYFIEGYSNNEFGDFHGWSLFYAKGPNGEQLEFNQVTRTIKDRYRQAQKAYNEAHGTVFNWRSGTELALPQSDDPKQRTIGELKKWPAFKGDKARVIREMFEAGESMNINNFVKFYDHDSLYQFGSFPVVYGPDAIRKNSKAVIETVEGIHHHIKDLYEMADGTIAIDMEVTYIRYDGKVITLPCFDTVKIENGRVRELRIFMDPNPIFEGYEGHPRAPKFEEY